MDNSGIRRPIVAVFGSQQHALAAMALGKAIAEKKWILLTGGDGDSQDNCSVKNAAIAGAAECGRWVGVHRTEDKTGGKTDGIGLPCYRHVGNGLVLEPRLGHKRNFLEAYLCDGAIAIAGGEGTISEVASCLYLKKKVVFVGWNDKVAVTLDRLKSDEYHPPIPKLDEDLKKLHDFFKDKPMTLPGNCQQYSIEVSPTKILSALSLNGNCRSGRFPEGWGERYEKLSAAFDLFVRGAPRT